jgi:hypothetical protein
LIYKAVQRPARWEAPNAELAALWPEDSHIEAIVELVAAGSSNLWW